jgi:DNA polymerase elongation subunit (family B)
MIFQALDWHSYHEKIENERKYMILIFGRTEDNKSICVKVHDFNPYFYIKIPSTWTTSQVHTLLENAVPKSLFNKLVIDEIKKVVITDTYIQELLVLDDRYIHIIKKIINDIHNFRIQKSITDYECIIHNEILKFEQIIFWKNVQPHISKIYTVVDNLLKTFMNKEFTEKIEYKIKLFQQALCSSEIVKKYDVRTFTNNQLYSFVKLSFTNYTAYMNYVQIFKKKIFYETLTSTPFKYKIYESDINPILKLIHLRNLETCGWIEIPDDKYVQNESDYTSRCAINIDTHWINLHRHNATNMCKFIIASFDIECYNETGHFPVPQADPIIQIGTTFSYFGSSECFYRHIVTLKQTSELDQIDVESFDNEKDMLIAWGLIIQKMDPDIMIGYNIFGFDYDYIYKRCIKLDIETHMSKLLSRFIAEQAQFKSHFLSSSALGDNILKYYHPKGIVQIDLMKTIQKDYKLESYKLDSVASYFIKEKILKIYDNKIDTTSTFGLRKGLFITIHYNDGLSDIYFQNGKKFQIKDIVDKTIILYDT